MMDDFSASLDFCFKVGGISFLLRAASAKNEFFYPKRLNDFACANTPEITLNFHHKNGTFKKEGNKIFSAPNFWDMHRDKNNIFFYLYSSDIPDLPYTSARFNNDFTGGDIYANKNPQLNSLISPVWEYPLDELLMINLLSLGRGMITHAAGVDIDGKGYLFLGRSGAGKSTISKLLKDRGKVLSDDRIIVRKKSDKFFIYGTPWHGEANLGNAGSCPLNEIFFLKHAQKNTAAKIPAADAATKMLIYSFPPFWNNKGMDFTLKFCAQLAQALPVYELGFIPDKSIEEFILSR